MESIKDFKRTNYCGDLRKEDIGKEVILMGWVAKERNLGSLIFIDLRDTTGISQIVVREEEKEAFEKAEGIRGEYVIAVKGKVEERESKNPNMDTGDVEINVKELRILDRAKTPPIYIKDDDDAQEEIRLKYRYLDLRKKHLQDNLKLRAKTARVFREFLDQENFVEVETPVLNKPTPEGARDYLVPSRVNPEKFYALPQSPQLMKQLLMVAGMDRYYQIVKCFRDEDLRANRQPEFTQVDIEMSFVDEEDVMDLNERLLQKIFKEVKGVDIEIPFRRMSYQEAMENYGSDKPDLRFGFPLKNLTEIVKDSGFKVFSGNCKEGYSVRGINIGDYEKEFSRKKVDRLEKFVKGYGAKGLAWIRIKDGEISSPIAKFLSEDEMDKIMETMEVEKNGLLLIVADKNNIVFEALSGLRNHLGKELGLKDPKDYQLAWVVDFPLFEYSEEDDRYVSKHHPFTHPRMEDLEFLEDSPEKVRSIAYDIVCNGDELAGGSIRINNRELQEKMFKALNLSDDEIQQKFGFFVEALQYGTPPHGGIAYGLDRLIMILAETDNIKDVIAFPKTKSATDLLTEAPSNVTEDQLEEVHIQFADGK
ncbi:MAG: aspartate--tRNA ligase [Tissierellia bacterium]|nr:aspartate--tRNA ligase [Tissierellia bacterium]